MALKKLSAEESAKQMAIIEQNKARIAREREEERRQAQLNNLPDEAEEDENLMNELIQSNSNTNSDSFFNTEEHIGASNPIVNLEINLPTNEAITEGRYQFEISNVGIDNQVSTAFGVKNQVWLIYHLTSHDDEQNEYEVKQKYNISSSNKSRFYEIYKALMGVAPFGKINLKNLLGVSGYCNIEHIQMQDGNIFPRVINICSVTYQK